MFKKKTKQSPKQNSKQAEFPIPVVESVPANPDQEVKEKIMHQCVSFKNPLLILEHDAAYKMVEDYTLFNPKYKDNDDDTYVIDKSYGSADPYLNNLCTGMSVLDAKEGESERQLVLHADAEIAAEYASSKKLTMLSNLQRSINGNLTTNMMHANKLIMDATVNSLANVGVALSEEEIKSLYENRLIDNVIAIDMWDLGDPDADMYKLLSEADKGYNDINPGEEDPEFTNTVVASLDLIYGKLYQEVMRYLSEIYSSIISNVRYAVYAYARNKIGIVDADYVFEQVVDYANQVFLSHGNMAFDNVLNMCEILPYVQDSYFRRQLTNWDENKLGLCVETIAAKAL